MIEVKGLHKKYSKETQIGPIDMIVNKPGITTLIGPNGAGKSTTLLMIGRLLEKDGGSVSLAGQSTDSMSLDELAKKLAILRQENHFVTRLTVRQLVAFGRYPHSKGRLTSADEEVIDRYIDFFDLSNLQNRFLDELSGGQRQRTYVAMVLCQETDYVLLDEPLNNLDVCNSVQMLTLLRRAADELDRAIVLVLHDINFASQYSDYIYAMKNGKLIHAGKTEEIMQSDILEEIFETDIEILNHQGQLIAVY